MIINKNSSKFDIILKRGSMQEDRYMPVVLDIIKNVKERGDGAVIEYTNKFDKSEITGVHKVSGAELDKAIGSIDGQRLEYIRQAAGRIRAFHEKQLEKSWFYYDNGMMLGQKITPLDSVGVYVPGGKAAYPSSVLMNVIPAKVAGVERVVMVSPAPGGNVNPVVLAAAKIAGVTDIFLIGGAQAVAALAYGTETVPCVDKIVGPGNIYVALAKKMLFGTVDIDMIAGPSEILIIADESAEPGWVAADMLSQAEHDELASAVAVVTSGQLAKSIEKEIYRQLEELPRKEIAAKSIESYSAIVVVNDLEEACEVSNSIAPEHLELMVREPLGLLNRIKHAGAIFLGHYTPESYGDFFAGPNHVLPTGGTARFFSPLGVYDFCKRSSIISYTKEMAEKHCAAVSDLAESEGLDAHKRSAQIRFK